MCRGEEADPKVVKKCFGSECEWQIGGAIEQEEMLCNEVKKVFTYLGYIVGRSG